MYYNGKVMLDPLSLNDIVTDTASEVHVKVEVHITIKSVHANVVRR